MAPKRLSALDKPSVSEEYSDTEKPHYSKPTDSESSNEVDREKPIEPSADYDVSGSSTDLTGKPIKGSENPHTLALNAFIKKPMKENQPSNEQKKSPFVRFWTDHTVVAILKSMHEYRVEKGTDPYDDTNAFFEFVKKFVPSEATKRQLLDKIRKLKKKYKNNAAKGVGHVFSTPHDKETFELSKLIWGGAAGGSMKESGTKRKVEKNVVENKRAKREKPFESVKENDKETVVDEEGGVSVDKLKGDVGGFWDNFPMLKKTLEADKFEFCLLKDGKINNEKAKELEGRWKKFHAKEAKLKMAKLDLLRDQTQVVYEELLK